MHKSTVIGRLIKLVRASKLVFIITKKEHLLDIIRPILYQNLQKKGEGMTKSMMLDGL